MCILLIEQDPFVRTDMAQALQSSFPSYPLVLADMLSGGAVKRAPKAVVTDTLSAEEADGPHITDWESTGAGFVWSGPASHDVPDHWLRLQRPFTEAMLVEIVRKALFRESAGV